MPRTQIRARRARALIASLALAVALPATASASHGSHPNPSLAYVVLTPAAAGGQVVPLINSGQDFHGVTFEGIPDGIGAVPAPGNQGWVDLYVTHEQSHVPFGGFADFQDSSVSRVRVDVAAKQVIGMDVPLPASAGFLRFCSAFMAGPEHGFPHYTFLVNEESNDLVPVPAGAPYGADPSVAPLRQAGYAVYLDTRTGKYDVMPGQGRHNHENTVVVPGGWGNIVSLSTDDTFTSPSTPERPNLSQLYLHTAKHWASFQSDAGTLWAFRVTATDDGPVDPTDSLNDANDFFEIAPGDTWAGEFIPVPEDVASGTTGVPPQDALEDWSNENNAFQFIRLEDIAFDPDAPRTVYIADTGNTRLWEDEATGRVFRLSSSDPRVPSSLSSSGRVFKFVLSAEDATQVESFSILADSTEVGFRSPDNMDVGDSSLMLQEDTSNAKIWMHSLATGAWTHVATVDQDNDPATSDPGESSGIVDVSRWFGDGWWALDVQSHLNLPGVVPGQFWTGPGGPAPGTEYSLRREDGQLMLMHVPGS
jgi:Bacterial protein of unknown function (DUF839)